MTEIIKQIKVKEIQKGKEKSNVPKLRFKGFEDEWETSNLNILCEINPKSKYLPDEFIYIDLESVVNGILIKNNKISIEDAPSRAQRILEVGDILFQTVRPYQMNNYIFLLENELKSVASTGYAQLRSKRNKSINTFIYQLIHNQRFNNNVLLRCTGTSYPAITCSELGNISIKIPGLHEQKKMADFLSLVDKKVEKQSEKVEALKTYQKGIIQKIFKQEIRFKDENGREYPEWEEKRFGDIGKTYTGLSGKTKEDFETGNAKYITYMNVFKNIKIKSELIDIVDIKDNENQNKVLEGDLLFTTSSETAEEVGMVSLCDKYIENLYLNSFCFGFRIKNLKINSNFIVYYLRSPKIRKKISILAQGSTRYNLSKNELMKLAIEIPCIEEQTQIATFLCTIDERMDKEEKKLEELKVWKKGLLQKMFI